MRISTIAASFGLLAQSALVSAGFAPDCRDISLYRERYNKGALYLEATCYDLGGASYMRTGLDLNKCIGNDGKNLVAKKGGNFYSTCSEYYGQCTIKGTVLGCTCQSSSNYYQYMSIDLNDSISRDIVWMDCFGQKSQPF